MNTEINFAYLIALLANLTKPEKQSQFQLNDDQNGNW